MAGVARGWRPTMRRAMAAPEDPTWGRLPATRRASAATVRISWLRIAFCCYSCGIPLQYFDKWSRRHRIWTLEPQNGTQKFFAFVAKNLSKLWVTTLLVLFIQWVLFRPIDVKPHAFDLQQADAMAATPGAPHLRFNLTAYLLFKNAHNYYSTNYDNLAVSVLYAGEKLGPVDDELPSFKQDPHGSTVIRLVCVGQLRNASSTVAEMFSSDRDKGLFEMVVRMRVTLGYKSWPFKDEYFTIYDCSLSSPFPQTGEPALSSPAWCKTYDI
ncbi:unnamed protein product [Miscanthus lutarioriparius]|uniref:Late embryogenesis abundant protein LEA-2 subgroup domain-containing protein n=1 Tax=Miscanthus lutarioriparius TaxID=422564 RepID=A0A811QFX4_9POAL|nr:unnamed protein product [Miscanthus lutarioriparius]